MKRQHLAFFTFISFALGLIGVLIGSFITFYFEGDLLKKEESNIVPVYESHDFTKVWEDSVPAVVSIVAMKELSQRYQMFSSGRALPDGDQPSSLTEVSSGTAFIISPDGLALTNKHVVADTEAEYVVILDDGTELEAQVLDRDTLNDIAILLITGDDSRIGELPYLNFADSDEIEIGQPVLAIGNALGEYANTATAGIVSALGRDILASGAYGSVESLVSLIQTDAAINPGNSGGPLLNLEGEVIGMNTAVDASAAGIGFAIPSNDLSLVLDSYFKYGKIVRPFLGVRYVMSNPALSQRFNLGYDYGAFIIGDRQADVPAVVEGSPAEKAGLKARDLILSVNGQKLDFGFTLGNALASYSVGDEVLLEIWRDGEVFETSVILGEQS